MKLTIEDILLSHPSFLSKVHDYAMYFSDTGEQIPLDDEGGLIEPIQCTLPQMFTYIIYIHFRKKTLVSNEVIDSSEETIVEQPNRNGGLLERKEIVRKRVIKSELLALPFTIHFTINEDMSVTYWEYSESQGDYYRPRKSMALCEYHCQGCSTMSQKYDVQWSYCVSATVELELEAEDEDTCVLGIRYDGGGG